MLAATRSSTTDAVTESSRPYRGRRVSWAEFYALRPDLRPGNDNALANCVLPPCSGARGQPSPVLTRKEPKSEGSAKAQNNCFQRPGLMRGSVPTWVAAHD